MKTCRACRQEFEPSARAISRRDWICNPCKNAYHSAWKKTRRRGAIPTERNQPSMPVLRCLQPDPTHDGATP